MKSSDLRAIVDLIAGMNFVEFAERCEKWTWKAMWNVVIRKFAEVEVTDLLELANMNEHDVNPLAEKKVAIFKSKCFICIF